MPEDKKPEESMLLLMTDFRRAYGRGDKEGLQKVTSDNFEWHQHATNAPSDLPLGRVLQVIDELLVEIKWRQTHWTEVEYSDLEERAAGTDLLVQTFVIRGFEDGAPFHAKAVDLYPVMNGKIIRKDTYWKYLK